MNLIKFFSKKCNVLLPIFLFTIVNINLVSKLNFDSFQITANRAKNFELNNILTLEDEYNTLDLLTKFTNIDYDKYQNKNINVYYSINNKREVIYSFIKNIICHNIKKYFNNWLSAYFNVGYPIIRYINEYINYGSNDIYFDIKFNYNNQEYWTDSSASIMNNLTIDQDGNVYFTLRLLSNSGTLIKLNNKLDNFSFKEISNVFDYKVKYLSTDITQVDNYNIKKLFSIYDNVPDIFLFTKEIKNGISGINVKNIKFHITTGIQNFNLNYVGSKFLAINPIDITIRDNKIIEKTNIFTLDKISIENLFHIGKTIKNIGYKIEIQKDFSTNKAKIIFLLNSIDSNLIFADLLNKIQKEYEVVLNFNENHILSIDVQEQVKNKQLPGGIKRNEIEILGTIDLNNVTIQSIDIIEANNHDGTLKVNIVYNYKNHFGIFCQDNQEVIISNLLKLNYKKEDDIKLFLKNSFYDENKFNFSKFKNYFLTTHEFDWLLDQNDVFINKNNLSVSYKNNILSLNFYIENKFGEIIFKDNFQLKLTEQDNVDEKETNTNEQNTTDLYLWIGICIGVIIVIIIIVIILRKVLKNKRNILK